jgi:hypothetical protein
MEYMRRFIFPDDSFDTMAMAQVALFEDQPGAIRGRVGFVQTMRPDNVPPFPVKKLY